MNPHEVRVYVRSDSGSTCLALAPQCAQSIASTSRGTWAGSPPPPQRRGRGPRPWPICDPCPDVMRSYRDSLACSFFPCWARGRSWASEVVVAIWRTPQSTPITRPVSGSGCTRAGTTNEQYQCPTVSWYTGTLEGEAGRLRDHTGVRTMPPAQVQTAVFETEPALRVVQARPGLALLLPLRHPGPLPLRKPLADVLVRLGPGLPEVSDDLLLRHRAFLPQPRRTGTGLGQHPVEPGGTAGLLAGVLGPGPVPGVDLPGLGHALVPHPPVPVPLAHQRRVCARRHPKPKRPPMRFLPGVRQGLLAGNR